MRFREEMNRRLNKNGKEDSILKTKSWGAGGGKWKEGKRKNIRINKIGREKRYRGYSSSVRAKNF